jgi:hypothetical protein
VGHQVTVVEELRWKHETWKKLGVDSYKERPGFKYNSVEELVIAEGVPFTSAQVILSHDSDAVVKECFSNALHLANRLGDGYHYAEGFAHNYIMAVHHAWVVTPEGKVLDPTWETVARMHGEHFPRPELEYHGLVLDTRKATRQVLSQDCYGLLYERGTEKMLRNGVKHLQRKGSRGQKRNKPESGSVVTERKCRETGFMVQLCFELVDSPWTIVCVEHGFSSDFQTRADAEQFLSHPKSEGWCEICSGSYVPYEWQTGAR